MVKLIADGNSKLNRFSKNTDPKDRSLWEGRASSYFPTRSTYTAYLMENPTAQEVSSTASLFPDCTYNSLRNL
jgi:hypothetical protein